MAQGRFGNYVDRIRAELHVSFTQEYTSHQIAASFALGTFITMLPTLGVGLLVFVVLVYLFDWINKIALFASVLVFNPVVKWGVYAASFALGFFLLGPVEGFAVGDVPSLHDGNDILIRLLVGNLILAVIATGIGYVVVYRLVETYDRNQIPVVEEVVNQIVADIEESPSADEQSERTVASETTNDDNETP